MNGVAPALSWNNAFDENGNTVDYDFEDFYCDESKLAIVLVVVTAWCLIVPISLELCEWSERDAEAWGLIFYTCPPRTLTMVLPPTRKPEITLMTPRKCARFTTGRRRNTPHGQRGV